MISEFYYGVANCIDIMDQAQPHYKSLSLNGSCKAERMINLLILRLGGWEPNFSIWNIRCHFPLSDSAVCGRGGGIGPLLSALLSTSNIQSLLTVSALWKFANAKSSRIKFLIFFSFFCGWSWRDRWKTDVNPGRSPSSLGQVTRKSLFCLIF